MDTSVKRDRKRAVQYIATKTIKDVSTKYPSILDGSIVTLCGENPKQAIQYFEEFNLFKKCLLVEYDQQIYFKALRTYKHRSPKTHFRHDDVFNVVKNNAKDIVGIDYDFECTFNDTTIKNILRNLQIISDNSSKECIWIRVTTSHRGIKKRELRSRQNLAKILIEKYYDFTVIDSFNQGYRDTGPMNVFQLILKRKEK